MEEEISAPEELGCCVIQCERPLDASYWNAQYESNQIAWDLGLVSTPIKAYIDTLMNKEIAILIPGCGNSYEAEYLLDKGFSNITVIDIAPALVEGLQRKFSGNKNIKVLCTDFFNHEGQYDLIIEQTFFCALPPTMRVGYVYKMHQLLKPKGILAGLLFNTTFEKQGPPFGGDQQEYVKLFSHSFNTVSMSTSLHSDTKRAGQELWIEFQKNNKVHMHLFAISGLTCSSCAATVSNKYLDLENVLHVQINSNYSQILVVSEIALDKKNLQDALIYEPKYILE